MYINHEHGINPAVAHDQPSLQEPADSGGSCVAKELLTGISGGWQL